MSASNRLSPMASYYVRRLIQAHRALILEMIVDTELSEMTLLEPEEILNCLVKDASERLQRLQNLEILTRVHQSLASDGKHPQQLQEVEQQMLLLLGFSAAKDLKSTQKNPKHTTAADHSVRTEWTIAKTIEILEALVSCGELYLGSRISREYFVSTCPASLKLNGFEFQADNRLKVSREGTDILQGNDAEDFKLWIKRYINRCSGIIHGFETLVNQEHLAYCSISRQEIQLAQ